MARIRSIKPEFWLDRKLARKLSRDERMLYMGLWNQADEHGRANGDPNAIKGAVFPYEADISVDDVQVMLNRLDAADVACRYEVDDDPYLLLPKLGEHQRLEPDRVKSKFPNPPENLGSRKRIVTVPEVFADESACGVDEPENPSNMLVEDESEPVQIFADSSEKTSGAAHASLWDREHGAGSMSRAKRTASQPDPAPNQDDPPGFNEFWTEYPVRSGRGAAVKAFTKAKKKVGLETILDGVRRYASDQNRTEKFTKNPATWLNQECWADDPLPNRNGGRASPRHVGDSPRDIAQSLIRETQENS